MPSVAEDGEEQKLSYIADGNVKWYKHFGKHFECFFKS